MSDSVRNIKNITVLMAVYNDSAYLENAVKSILNQTHKDFEFLIIDDGSEDSAEEVINGFKDTRINYKKISHRGLAGALNYGLKISSGDFVARIDADDLSTPDRLGAEIDFMEKNPGYDVVSSRSVYFKDPDKILFYIKPPEEDEMIKRFLNLHNPINHSSVIFDRKKILESGGYNEEFKSYEDFELWFRMKDKLKFRILPDVLVFTRMREGSMTRTGSKEQIRSLLLENARKKMNTAGEVSDKRYWKNILFWAEYFYGKKDRAREHFANDISIKKSLAYINTFLPGKIFQETIEYRVRQRIQSQMSGRKKFRQELLKLLK